MFPHITHAIAFSVVERNLEINKRMVLKKDERIRPHFV